MEKFVIKYFNEFKVKKGNIISYKQNNCNNYITLIVNEIVSDGIIAYAGLGYSDTLYKNYKFGCNDIVEIRFANKEEVKTLVEKLYGDKLYWNPNTFTLDRVFQKGEYVTCYNEYNSVNVNGIIENMNVVYNFDASEILNYYIKFLYDSSNYYKIKKVVEASLETKNDINVQLFRCGLYFDTEFKIIRKLPTENDIVVIWNDPLKYTKIL